MTADDTGNISVSIETRPGLISAQAEEMLNQAEAIVAANENVDSYMLRYNGNSGSITGRI